VFCGVSNATVWLYLSHHFLLLCRSVLRLCRKPCKLTITIPCYNVLLRFYLFFISLFITTLCRSLLRATFCRLADPEILSAIVRDIMQTHVTVIWDKGGTRVVNDTVVHYRATNPSSDWNMISVGDSSSHIVTSLQPGTEYQFFVVIHSFAKTVSSQSFTLTTGIVSYFNTRSNQHQARICRKRNLKQ